MDQKASNETEIDLVEVFHILGQNIVIILLVTAIGVLAGYWYTKTMMTPEYSSTTKLYVMAKEDQSSSSAVQNQDLQSAALLTKDYQQIIESREVTEAVIAQLNLTDENGDPITSKDLTSRMTVDSPTGTRIISITVTDSDPYRACDTANAVSSVSIDQIQSIMDLKTIKVVEAASVPTKPDGPNASKNALLAGLVCMLVAMIVVIVRNLSNDAIKSPEDIQKYLGLSTLGVIPMMKGQKTSKKKRKNSKKRMAGAAR